MIVTLNQTHFSSLLDLNPKENLLSLQNYFLNNSEINYHIFGVITDGRVCAYSKIIDNQELPLWSLNQFVFKEDCIKEARSLYEHILVIQEQKNLWQYYTTETFWKLYLPDRMRYNNYVEHVVPANQLTGYETVDQEVFNCETDERQRTVYLRVLKNEYRLKSK
jgi:hypothetical protein